MVGKIAGPWGLRGDLKITPLTDFPERFSPGSRLYLKGRPTRVQYVRTLKGGLRVKLDMINDRTQAEAVRGDELTVPWEDVRPLPDGSYYHFQIIDMGVWTEEEEYLGAVKEILHTGGNDVYVVRDRGNKELLIPAIEDVVLKVDPSENRMVVRLPEGLA